MNFQHRSGILLHVTSLPCRFGIGDLGPQAYAWVDFLAASGTRWWQTLPLGPTGYGESPYQSYSSFALNPNLISPQLLADDGLLDSAHLETAPAFPTHKVDFPAVTQWKRGLYQVAFARLNSMPVLHHAFDEFCAQQSAWLDDYCLFMTLKSQYGQQAWPHWPAPLRGRQPDALAEARQTHAETLRYFAFQQFLLFRQWAGLRAYMTEHGVGIIGDLPIYVAHDSVDAWCRPELFELDERGAPLRVAGVPPDIFSTTGQLWGNPLYRWDLHKKQGYAWWLQRLRATLALSDVIRLDHFRGFATYYAIPASEDTAMNGTWEFGPGEDFFYTVERELGHLPLIAEDLGGEAAPEVIALRDQFNLPGMKVFQFGFDMGLEHTFLPHNYPVNCVAYSGTHDNDTFLGWFEHAPAAERTLCESYIKIGPQGFVWSMLEMLWGSQAALTVAPIQDFLELGSEARMNIPGTPLGNWHWRVDGAQLTDVLATRIADLNARNGRTA
ncbi:MAG: 4-alpha-glucanotransferase [Anaerolineales bacterium]|nr:MAG: 4-alpha-glucanotransferase [Anaerolineales bacterium]